MDGFLRSCWCSFVFSLEPCPSVIHMHVATSSLSEEGLQKDSPSFFPMQTQLVCSKGAQVHSGGDAAGIHSAQ